MENVSAYVLFPPFARPIMFLASMCDRSDLATPHHPHLNNSSTELYDGHEIAVLNDDNLLKLTFCDSPLSRFEH